MKKTLCLALFSALSLFLFSGCATYSKYGKKEVNILGGLVKVEGEAYPRMGPLTIGETVSTFNPRSDLDGDSVSILWGLIVISDQ